MCKHPRCKISEFCEEIQTHYFEGGKFAFTYSAAGDMINRINVHCPDCGMNQDYHTKRPKWVERRLQEAWDENFNSGQHS